MTMYIDTKKYDEVLEQQGEGVIKYFVIENLELSAGDITNKEITLGYPPLTSNSFYVAISGGILQSIETDYTIVGQVLKWDGLGMESILVAGDIIVVMYYTTQETVTGTAGFEDITITATHIANKYLTLEETPVWEPVSINLGGVQQVQDIDFEIIGDEIHWAGLGLESILIVGDNLFIAYIKT